MGLFDHLDVEFPTNHTADKTTKTTKTIKVKFYTVVQSLGDGSVAVRCFNSQSAAEHFESFNDEPFCDSISCKELEFDLNGNLVTPNPVHWREKDEG